MIFLSRNIKLLTILLIILIIVVGLFAYFSLFYRDSITVGTTEFTLPAGYHEDGFNQFGAVAATNGENSIFLLEYNDTDENKHIQDYLDYKNGSKESVSISKFNVNNKTIYKTNNIENPTNVHYWFVKGNKSYEVYNWDNNPHMDNIVMDLFNN